MAKRCTKIDVDTAAEATGLTAGVIANAMVMLTNEGLVDQLTRRSRTGPKPTGCYRITAAGARIVRER